jgi:prepilin-type N-terminal cleavage/methylation domain-containing protein/prepilin-type processing-associated H-X9-DG protein
MTGRAHRGAGCEGPARLAPAPPRPPHGFTLIELLVVVAIITLLLTLLMPSLERARELTRQAICASNLRNSLNHLLLYGQEWNDFLPPTGRKAGGSSNPENQAPWYYGKWVPKLLRQMDYEWELLDCPSAEWWLGEPWRETGLKGTYTFEGRVICKPHRVCLIASIGYNNQLAYNEDATYESHQGKTWPTNFWRWAELNRPDKLILMGDSKGGGMIGENQNGTVHNYYVGGGKPWWWYDHPYPLRHSEGGNYLFADGRVEWRAQYEVYRRDELFAP